WQLPWTAAAYFNQRGRFQDGIATHLVAVAAARRLEDPRAQAHSHYNLGGALSSMGDNETAEPNGRQALELFHDLGERGYEAMLLNGLANMLQEQGRLPEALEVALDGLRMVKAVGHWWRQGALENTVGWLYAHMGKQDLALAHCQ